METQLVTLASSGAGLRRVLAAIAGRLVRTRAWERLGFARVGDYARERAGVSGRQLYELARMDDVFVGIPRLEHAFLSGDLSWSRACLLARVATPENVEAWLARTRSLSARALAREVRAVDRCGLEANALDAAEESGPSETVRLQLASRARAKWSRARLLARQTAGHRLAPAEVAEAVVAEVLSGIRLVGERDESGEACGATAREEMATGAGTEAGCHAGAAQPDPEDVSDASWRRPAPEVLAGMRLRSEAACHAGGTDPDDVSDAPWRRTAPEALAGMPLRPPVSVCEAATSSTCLRPLTDGLEEASAFALDARLRRALRLEQQRLARMGPLLADVATTRSYRRLGFASLAAFVREWLGLSERTAQALLRLERAGRVCPPLRDAWRSGRLSWVQGHTLVPLVLRDEALPFRAAWVDHARHVSVRRLEDDVERALALGAFDPQTPASTTTTADPLAADTPPPGEDPQTSARTTTTKNHFAGETTPSGEDPQTSARPRAAGRAPVREPTTPFVLYRVPRDVARLLRATLATVQRRIERRTDRTSSESEAFEAMLEHALESWGAGRERVPREHRVFERDGWRCVVPGCSSQRNLHAHHVRFRSRGGSDALSNLATLCAWHHLRGVHTGIVGIAGRAPDRLRFELGRRRRGPALAIYRSGDRRVSASDRSGNPGTALRPPC